MSEEMTEQAREALEKSITHWEENLAADTPNQVAVGQNHCALCILYHNNDCLGCPVSGKTKSSNCAATPYRKAVFALHDWHYSHGRKLSEDFIEASKLAWQSAARDELEFLKGLRP